LNERRKTNLQDWAAAKLTADPVFAKPKAVKDHSNNERSQAADKNTDDRQIEHDYRVVQLN